MGKAPASQHPTRVVGYNPDTDEEFPLAGAGEGGGGGATEATLSALNDKIPASPATAGNQATGNASLASIDTKVPAKGQATKAGSTPVTLASDQDPVAVKESQSTTVVQGVVAVDTTIDQIVAADATRRRLIVTNDHASVKLGLSTEAASTYAQCPIKLAAGESWVEALAANKAWYAIYDTGGSGNVPYQTVV